jgi:hypothetical protein
MIDCPGDCKQVGRLSVIIPELGRFATVTILTTSIHDVINLTRQLRSYEAINGDLRGIPFVIVRRPEAISTPSGPNGKRARREKWLLSIESQPAWTRLQLGAMKQAALPEVTGDSVDTIDVAAIAAPFDDETEAESSEPPPTFASIDDLLHQVNIDFGLSEGEAKQVLKNLGFTGFKPSKSAAIYAALTEHCLTCDDEPTEEDFPYPEEGIPF